MKQVVPYIGLARAMIVSNVWLLRTDAGDAYLVDTGHPLERLSLRWHLWRAGIRGPGDLAGIILTHRHSDHAGNADWLRRHFGAPVLCHSADAAFLSGDAAPPKLAGGQRSLTNRFLCHLEDRFPARVQVDEVFEDDQLHRGFRVFHVPGHTEGSVLIHHESTRTLFSGDSILGGPPTFRVVEWLQLAYDDFSADGQAARAAVRTAIGQLPRTEVLCAGHGPAVAHDVDRKLRDLARDGAGRPRRVRR